MTAQFKSLYDLFETIPDELAAINYFKSIVWKNGEHCPYCGHDKVYSFAMAAHGNARDVVNAFQFASAPFLKIRKFRCASGLLRSGLSRGTARALRALKSRAT